MPLARVMLGKSIEQRYHRSEKGMRNIAVTLITLGILAPACGGRGTPKEVLHPLPEFAEYEPQRVPLIPEEGEAQAVAQVPTQGTTPMAAITIVGMIEPEQKPELEPVYFSFGSAALDLADLDQLGETANWLRAHPEQQIVIEGHTDAVGPSQYNLILGEQRARAVRDYLIQLGVGEERLAIASLGEEQPVSEERRDLNRRSEVVPVPDADPQ
jgi:outer membrane protein OmpA-like peptidoglycan-associated protein